jgi:hypothetical protein
MLTKSARCVEFPGWTVKTRWKQSICANHNAGNADDVLKGATGNQFLLVPKSCRQSRPFCPWGTENLCVNFTINIYIIRTLKCLCYVSEHARCYNRNQPESSCLLFKVNFGTDGGDVSIWIHYLFSEVGCSTRMEALARRRVGNS